MSGLIPLQKLATILPTLTPLPGKENVILISTGSLCPVHLMHLQMIVEAQQHLESTGNYQVLAGFLSPSQHNYVRSKLGNNAISKEDRIEMVRLICQENERIDVSSWEASIQFGFIDFPDVVEYHHNYFNNLAVQDLPQLRPFLPIKVMYVCGSDHAKRCGTHSLSRFGVVVVARPGITPSLRSSLLSANTPRKYVELTEKELEDTSSTKVRARIDAKQKVNDLCGEQVAEYLYNYYKYKPN